MPAFLLGPNGPVKIEETPVKPCPECGGASTTLVQQHKIKCTGAYGVCFKCREWYVINWYDTKISEHCSKCSVNPNSPPSSTSLFDIPPREYWGWRIESRVWVEFSDGRTDWTPWAAAFVRGTKRYYMSERAATRAFERNCPPDFYVKREYRVARFAMKHKVASKRRR